MLNQKIFEHVQKQGELIVDLKDLLRDVSMDLWQKIERINAEFRELNEKNRLLNGEYDALTSQCVELNRSLDSTNVEIENLRNDSGGRISRLESRIALVESESTTPIPDSMERSEELESKIDALRKGTEAEWRSVESQLDSINDRFNRRIKELTHELASEREARKKTTILVEHLSKEFQGDSVEREKLLKEVQIVKESFSGLYEVLDQFTSAEEDDDKEVAPQTHENDEDAPLIDKWLSGDKKL